MVGRMEHAFEMRRLMIAQFVDGLAYPIERILFSATAAGM